MIRARAAILLLALLAGLLPARASAYDILAPAGAGTAGDPYQLTTLSNLAWAMTTPESWSKNFTLNNDIDATDTKNWTGDNDGFLGLGRVDDPFTGDLDGNNHKITSLFISGTGKTMGFFIKLNGLVENLELADVQVTGGDNVGGLVGVLGGQVLNCTVAGKVTGDSQTGGIAGKMEAGSSVTRSSASVAVTGVDNVGGLAGYSCGIVDSEAFGAVTGFDRVGGLVGTNGCDEGVIRSAAEGAVEGQNSVGGLEGEGNGPVIQSVARGKVIAASVGAGGLAGVSHRAISDSYATGDVSATDSAGGLVGQNADSTATITRAYANGLVTAATGAGGLIGRTSGFPTVTASYWDKTSSGLTSSAGGSGSTTTFMTRAVTFAGWDFGTIWEISEGASPPTLQWENAGGGSGGGGSGSADSTDAIRVSGFECFLEVLGR